MQDQHNELNDIILNRSDRGDSRKKMLIGIGVLAIVMIVIVVVMGNISGSEPSQLPKPVLSSEQTKSEQNGVAESAEAVIDEQLAAVAEKVKQKERPPQTPSPVETQSEIIIIDETSPAVPVKKETPAAPKNTPAEPSASAAPGDIYIQVGSFSRYKPEASFLKNIEKSGYSYTLHRVVTNGKINNKVLIGPFRDRGEARSRLAEIRKTIEPGAFIYAIK